MKKILSVVLAMIMVLSMGVVAFAAGEPTIAVGKMETIEEFERYETFDVPVYISNNPGFASVQMTVDYDKDLLKLENIELGLVAGEANAENGKIAGATAADVTGDGVLFTLTFMILSAEESYDVDIIINEFYNAGDEEVIAAGEVVKLFNINACAHAATVVEGAEEATCEEPGYTGDVYCANCGKFLENGEEIAPAHTFGAWVVVKEATEKETGLKRRDCEKCDHYEESVIPKKAVETDPIVVGGDDKDDSEENPNTGASVIGAVAALAVLSTAAVVLGKKN